MKERKNTPAYTLAPLQNIPLKIDLTDLNYQNKLLTETQISVLKKANLDQGRTTKTDLKLMPGLEDIEYAVIRDGDGYYAIYHGLKQDKQIYYSKENERLVKYAQDLESGEWVVMKIEKYDLSADRNQITKNLDKEILGLKAKGQYVHVNQRENKQKTKFQNEYLIKHIPGNDLLDLIEHNKFMPAHMWLDIAIKSLQEVNNFHASNMIHRDIKSQNIMHGYGKTTLIDFGYSEFIPPDDVFIFKDAHGVGTEIYMAPEIFQDVKTGMNVKYDEKTEVYALGQTNAELLGLTIDIDMNHGLISIPSHPDQKQQTGDNLFRENLNLPPRARQEAYVLSKQMLDTRPENRPVIVEAINHLKKIREEKLDADSRCLQTAYLDVNEYYHADLYTRAELIKSLQSVNEILLIGEKNEESLMRSLTVKHDLEIAELPVQDTLLQCDKKNILQAISQYTQDRMAKDNTLYYSNIYATSEKNFSKELLNEYAIVLIHPDEGYEDINSNARNYTAEIEKGIDELPASQTDVTRARKDMINIYFDLKDKPGLQTALENLNEKLYNDAINKINLLQQDVTSTRNDLMALLRLYESAAYKLQQVEDARIKLLDDINQYTDSSLSDGNFALKIEAESFVNNLFKASYVDFDQTSLDTLLDHYQQQINLSQSRLDTIDSNIEQENVQAKLQIQRSKQEANEYRRTDLKKQVILCHHELKETLEKIILLEKYQKNNKTTLTPEEFHDISHAINLGYHTIIQCSYSLEKARKMIEQPLISPQEYLDTYTKIEWPQNEAIQHLLLSIRESNETTYQELSGYARDNLTALENPAEQQNVQNNMRLDTFNMIERSIHGYAQPGEDWRKDLFIDRLDRIVAAANEEIFPADQHLNAFKEYYDIQQAKLKPEYQSYWTDETIKRKVKAALKVFTDKELLLTHYDAAKELDSIIDDPENNREKFDNWRTTATGLACIIGFIPQDMAYFATMISKAAIAIGEPAPEYLTEQSNIRPPDVHEKAYHFDQYPAEAKQLSSLAIEMKRLMANKKKILWSNHILPEYTINQISAIKELNVLERRLKNQMQFVANHWQNYRVDAKNPDFNQILFTDNITKAQEVLDSYNRFIPYIDRLKFSMDVYNDSKEQLENRIQHLNSVLSEKNFLLTNDDDNNKAAIQDLRISLLTIIDEIDNLDNQYTRIKDNKKTIKKTNKHGHPARLLKNEKNYISTLSEQRNNFLTLLDRHDAEMNLLAVSQQLIDTAATLSTLAQTLPITEARKAEFNNKLKLIQDDLSALKSDQFIEPTNQPASSITLLNKRTYIATIKNNLNQLLLNELKYYESANRTILDLMVNNPVIASKEHDDRNIRIASLKSELNNIMHRLDEGNMTTTGFYNKFNLITQIGLDSHTLEKQYIDSICSQAYDKIDIKLKELDTMLQNCSPDDKEPIQESIDKLNAIQFFPADPSLAETLNQYHQIEDSLKIADQRLSHIKSLDKQFETALLNEALKLHDMISRCAEIAGTPTVKNTLTNLDQQLSALTTPYTNLSVDTFSNYSELKIFDKDIATLRDEFRNIILIDHIGNLIDKNGSILASIPAYNIRNNDVEKNLSYKLYTAIDTLAYHSAANENIVNEELIHLSPLAILSNQKISQFDLSIQGELEILETSLLKNMAAFQKALQTYEEIIQEYDEPILEFDADGQAISGKKDAHKSTLEELNGNLQDMKSAHDTTKLSYDYLDNTQSILNELALKCEINTSLLALGSVAQKELKHLQNLQGKYSDDPIYQNYISGKILELQTLQNKINSLDTKSSSVYQKHNIALLNNELIAMTDISIMNTLDEHIASGSIKTDEYKSHLINFYNLPSGSMNIDYKTHLQDSKIDHNRLLGKLDKLTPHIKDDEVFSEQHFFGGARAITDVSDLNDRHNAILDLTSQPDITQPASLESLPNTRKSKESDQFISSQSEMTHSRISELKNKLDQLKIELNSSNISDLNQSNLIEATIAAEYSSLSREIASLDKQLSATLDHFSSEQLDTIDSEMRKYSGELKHFLTRLQLRNEPNPQLAAEDHIFEPAEKLPIQNILDDKTSINEISQAAKKYFNHETSTVQFATSLLANSSALSKYPEIYEKLVALAQTLETDKHLTFTAYQQFNALLPDDAGLNAHDLNALESGINIIVDQPPPQKKKIPFSEKNRRIPLGIRPIKPSSLPDIQAGNLEETISDRTRNTTLANNLHELHLFMKPYDGMGLLRARDVDKQLFELQQHVKNVFDYLHEDDPLYKKLKPLYDDLYDSRHQAKITYNIQFVAPAVLDSHYLEAKNAVRDLENFTNQFVGPKQKGITSLIQSTNDLAVRAKRNVNPDAPHAKANLAAILKESEELRERISIIIGKKEASPASIIEALNDSVNMLTDTINNIKSPETPANVLAHAHNEIRYIELNEATPQENFLKAAKALKNSLKSASKAAITASTSIQSKHEKLSDNEFKLYPVETYTYDKHEDTTALFSKSASGIVHIANGKGLINNIDMGIIAYPPEIDRLELKELVIMAAIQMYIIGGACTTDENFPPELARAMEAYAKFSTDNYPVPDISHTRVERLSTDKQKKYDKKVKALLRDPEVVKRITNSTDVILSAELKAKQKKKEMIKLQKLSGQASPFKGG